MNNLEQYKEKIEKGERQIVLGEFVKNDKRVVVALDKGKTLVRVGDNLEYIQVSVVLDRSAFAAAGNDAAVELGDRFGLERVGGLVAPSDLVQLAHDLTEFYYRKSTEADFGGRF